MIYWYKSELVCGIHGMIVHPADEQQQQQLQSGTQQQCIRATRRAVCTSPLMAHTHTAHVGSSSASKPLGLVSCLLVLTRCVTH